MAQASGDEMDHPQLSSVDDALRAHRQFLQELLDAVMPVMSVGQASDDRLLAALELYWDACFERRDVRNAVLAITRGTAAEHAVEPMGKPFLMMVRAELRPRHGARADELALAVYDLARAIAVDEAVSGERALARRRALAELVRA